MAPALPPLWMSLSPCLFVSLHLSALPLALRILACLCVPVRPRPRSDRCPPALSAGVCWAGPAAGTRSCCGSAIARSRRSGGCPAPGCRCLRMRGATRRGWPRWCAAASCRSRPASCGWSAAAAPGAAAAAARRDGPFWCLRPPHTPAEPPARTPVSAVELGPPRPEPS